MRHLSTERLFYTLEVDGNSVKKSQTWFELLLYVELNKIENFEIFEVLSKTTHNTVWSIPISPSSVSTCRQSVNYATQVDFDSFPFIFRSKT